LSVVLYEPEIPANAGAVARLCAATATPLHLIGRLGFSLRHPEARRAGLDYWEHVQLSRHLNHAEFLHATGGRAVWAFSTRADRLLWDAAFQPGDFLLFGPESRGLPAPLVASAGERALRIPMIEGARSLNLASAVAVALYEFLRQTGFSPR
jgi:tRNA (cytidine/uridine-2'-O-)-methyltransferase